MKIARKLSIYLMVLSILFMVGGCATKFFNESGKQLPPGLGYAVQAIEQAENIYDPALTIVGKLHCDGKLTDEQAWKVVKNARLVKIGIEAARLSVVEWKAALDSKSDTESPKYLTYTRLIDMVKSISGLVAEYKQATGKSIKIPESLTENYVKLIFGGLDK